LSENFILGELLHSDLAERDEALKREQENPPPDIIENIQYLVDTALQPIRSNLEFSIRITSGYRCQTVNKLAGGSGTSQHCRGEAADCQLSPRFLTEPSTVSIREAIRSKVKEITGKRIKSEIGENFFLFAFICLHIDDLDVDQVIHEYGDDYGHPAWVHVSASRRQNKRQILCVGSYTNRHYLKPTLEEALSYGT
jgi:hypothetical protein